MNKKIMLTIFLVVAFISSGSVLAMAQKNEKDRIPSLIQELKERKDGTKERVITLLVKSKDPRAIEPLIEVMLSSKDADERAYTAGRLVAFNDTRTIPAYRKLLQDKDKRVRRESAKALLKLSDKKEDKLVVYQTIEILAKEGEAESLYSLADIDVRINKSNIRDEEAKQILIRTLEFSNEEVRTIAASLLKRQGLSNKKIDKIIDEALSSKSPRVKERVIPTLKYLGSRGDTESLKKLEKIGIRIRQNL